MGKLDSLLNYLIGAVVIIIAASFFYLRGNPEVHGQGTVLSSKEVDKVVNKYIHEASTEALRQKILTERALVEARKKIAELNKLNKIREQKELESIPAEKQIWKEADVKPSPEPQMAEARSDSSPMNDAEKKEFARQYIENAKKGGYAIELSEDLQIIKVTPLRKPSQESDSYESYPSN